MPHDVPQVHTEHAHEPGALEAFQEIGLLHGGQYAAG
jgi:hypothetical protein